MIIETRNLNMIPCDKEILKSAIKGNEILAKNINAMVQENWTEFGVGALQYSPDKLTESEEEKNWWTYFPIHKQDNKLIGSGGYIGKPTIDGTVELGYEITPEYRNRGLATGMTKGLIGNALRDERVKSIIAHTLGQVNPSTKVLQKCGFKKVEEINDPDDGLIWKWELKRPKDNFLSLLGAPARRALENADIQTLKQLSKFSEKDILKLHGIGKTAIPILKTELNKAGLAFND